MAVIEGLVSGSGADVGVAASMPIHVTVKPVPYGALGHYRQARRLLLATSQAAGVLWEFQWTDTTRFAVVSQVKISGVQIAAATAEELRFNFKAARNFTAADTTNTASILPTGNNQKLRTSMGNTLLGAFRESNSATAAAGGTKTLDTDSMAQGGFVSVAAEPTTVVVGPQTPILDFQPKLDEAPLVLAQNEGWAISLEVAKGATQGVVIIMETTWVEVTAY